jgi:putative heme-binding domain-containing protein
VVRLAAGAVRPEARAQAWWTVQTLGGLTAEHVRRALQDEHAGVRRQALRLSETLAERPAELLAAIMALADDPDLAVRQQVAYTLGEWRDPVAGVALARLLRANDDRFVRAAAMSSALPHAETLIAELSAGGRGDDPLVIEIATATENAKALANILQAIARHAGAAAALQQFRSLGQLLDWLTRNNKTLAQLQATGGAAMGPALAAADGLFEKARSSVRDARAPLEVRLAAVHLVGRGRTQQSEDLQLLAGLLSPQVPVELQLAAVNALGRMTRSSVPEKLLDGWTGYGPKVRAAVLQLVTSRPAWGHVLLDRIEKDRSLLAQIDAAPRLALVQHNNARVAQRAAEIFRSSIDGDRQKAIDRYLAAVSANAGDAARGRTVFAQSCSACHTFGDRAAGRLIGPDLAAVKDRTAPYLLTHILDPNRAVEDRYVLYTAATQDGRALAGMLAGESANSLTLIGLDGVEQVVLRSELRSLVSTGRSLMPDGLEAAINERAMADLLAFLAGSQAAAER